MTTQEVENVVLELLRTIAPDMDPRILKPADNIRVTLGIDSFDYLQFIVGFDERFGIQTPEADYGKIETLQALIPYIRDKLTTRSKS